MDNSVFCQKAKWMVWCVETPDGFAMTGSRKIKQLDIEVQREFDTLLDGFYNQHRLYMPTTYTITGQFGGFTMVVAQTEFGAFTSLMAALREDERLEEEEKAAMAARIEETRQREAEEEDYSWADDYDEYWDHDDSDYY